MRKSLVFLVVLVFWAEPAFVKDYPLGDLNFDRKVDFEDIQVLAQQWLSHPASLADLNNDEEVGMIDFALLAEDWRQSNFPLVINEFMASNNSTYADPQDEYDDWIEIYNAGRVAIDIGGMYLTDDLAEPAKWQIPNDNPSVTTIPAGGYLVIWADGDTQDTGLHANFNLNAAGEELGLFNTDANTVIDSISFGQQTVDISYGRYPDASGNLRFFGYPTPGQENNDAYFGVVEDVRFSHDRGFYDTPFSVKFTTETEGATIHYTLDGSEPGDMSGRLLNGYVYTEQIPITKTTCLRAIALKTGWKPSNVDTHTYIFNASDTIKTMPLISLVGDEGKTFYEPDGIMAIVGGHYSGGVWQSDGPGSYNNPINRGRAYERPVSFEILDSQAGTNTQIDCGIRVAGSNYHRPRYTRGDNWDYNYDKFSFKLFFRNTYGDDKLDYPFFPLADTDSFKAISLRGGHNDVHNPFIKDEMLRRLHKDMGGVAVIGTVANLFLNGQHKSFYNPCERLDHDFFRDYYDVDTDWDVITQLKVRNGDSKAWNATIDFFRYNDLSITANYEQAGQMIDIVDFIDYLIIQLYSANWDWPNNNWTVSRERTPQGKFRFHCWDMEGTMETQYLNSFGFDDFPSWSPGGLNGLGSPLARLYRSLKANSEFRILFADRIQKHFFYDGALTPANIERRFTELRQQMSQVLPGMNTSILTSWIPNRHQIMLDKFTVEGLFPSQGPALLVNGSLQHGGQISLTDQISMAVLDVISYIDFELVAEGAPVRVRVPVDNSLGFTWTSIAFVPDSSWTDGSTGTGVGYERGSGYGAWIGTDVSSQMYGGSTSVFTRTEFNYDGGQDFDKLELQMRYDDGFIAYLNGTEVYRSSNVYNDTPGFASAGNHEAGSEYEKFNITGFKHLLIVGTNVLAFHGVNTSNTSSDMLVMPRLVGQFVDITHSSAPIWYTTDGSDPRLQGGSLNPTAIEYTYPFTLSESRYVKARTLDNGQWSALNEAIFAIGPVAENLRITEIMYNPGDYNEPNDPNPVPSAAEGTEYIELTNIGSETINLNLVKFTNGVDFTFSDMELAPGGFVLIVKDESAFLGKYPSFSGLIAGQYTGSLNNAGERIELQDAIGQSIHNFRYRDNWYDITDGLGFSLTIKDPVNTDPDVYGDKADWRPSATIDGSPGYDDSDEVPALGSVVINEILTHSHLGEPDWIELHNTTDHTINIGGWFLSDDDSDFTKYEMASGTAIPANGYIVFYEDVHFGNPADSGCHVQFALSENGETLYLHSGRDGLLTGYSEQENFGASETAVAFGRYQKSTGTYNFVAMSENTAGYANAYPLVGPVVINEIMYHPDIEGDAEYVELLNITGDSVLLYDSIAGEPWRFTDDPDDPGLEFLFPTGPAVTVGPGEYILLVKDVEIYRARFGEPLCELVFEWGSGKLSNGGEKIQLSKPGDVDGQGVRQWIRVDRVVYSDGSHPVGEDPWPMEADGGGLSLSRMVPSDYGNDVVNWQAAEPSPGQANP